MDWKALVNKYEAALKQNDLHRQQVESEKERIKAEQLAAQIKAQTEEKRNFWTYLNSQLQLEELVNSVIVQYWKMGKIRYCYHNLTVPTFPIGLLAGFPGLIYDSGLYDDIDGSHRGHYDPKFIYRYNYLSVAVHQMGELYQVDIKGTGIVEFNQSMITQVLNLADIRQYVTDVLTVHIYKESHTKSDGIYFNFPYSDAVKRLHIAQRERYFRNFTKEQQKYWDAKMIEIEERYIIR